MIHETFLFVYGTLLRSGTNSLERMGEDVRYFSQGVIRGTLYHVNGWFPGLSLEGNTPIKGEVFTINKLAEARLDKYEGVEHGLYVKEEVEVEIPYGMMNCLVYVASDKLIEGKKIITCGDWIKYIKKHHEHTQLVCTTSPHIE